MVTRVHENVRFLASSSHFACVHTNSRRNWYGQRGILLQVDEPLINGSASLRWWSVRYGKKKNVLLGLLCILPVLDKLTTLTYSQALSSMAVVHGRHKIVRCMHSVESTFMQAWVFRFLAGTWLHKVHRFWRKKSFVIRQAIHKNVIMQPAWWLVLCHETVCCGNFLVLTDLIMQGAHVTVDQRTRTSKSRDLFFWVSQCQSNFNFQHVQVDQVVIRVHKASVGRVWTTPIEN